MRVTRGLRLTSGKITRGIVIVLLAMLYLVAGRAHVIDPAPFLVITPAWVPFPQAVIYWTGLAEIAGACALAQPFGPRLRQAAAIGLSAYALCVWPANFNHLLLDLAREDGGWGLGYHVPRLAFQPVLIWAPLWASRLVTWPFERQKR